MRQPERDLRLAQQRLDLGHALRAAPPGSFDSMRITRSAELLGHVLAAALPAQRQRRILDLHRERRDVVLAVERHDAAQHLVGHDAERVDVAAVVVAVPARALGRDVLGRARDLLLLAGLVHEARDAEVDDLDGVAALAALHEHDVVGLDVEVDDALLVRGAQRLRDLAQDGDRARRLDARRLAQHARRATAPSRYSMTKKTRPSASSPKSVTSQMYALPTFEAARASCAELLQRLGVARDVGAQQLERDLLLEVDVLATRYTLPMPPSPIFERMR